MEIEQIKEIRTVHDEDTVNALLACGWKIINLESAEADAIVAVLVRT